MCLYDLKLGLKGLGQLHISSYFFFLCETTNLKLKVWCINNNYYCLIMPMPRGTFTTTLYCWNVQFYGWCMATCHAIGKNCHESQHLIQPVIQHENLIFYNKKVHHLLSSVLHPLVMEAGEYKIVLHNRAYYNIIVHPPPHCSDFLSEVIQRRPSQLKHQVVINWHFATSEIPLGL